MLFICGSCFKLFEGYAYHFKASPYVYCSKECKCRDRVNFAVVSGNCGHCGDSFVLSGKQVCSFRDGKAVYCSKRCVVLAAKGDVWAGASGRVNLGEMIELRRNGATLKEIGDKFGLTRERIRQLLARAGVPNPVRVKSFGFRGSCVVCGGDVFRSCKPKHVVCSGKCGAVLRGSKSSRHVMLAFDCAGCGKRFERSQYLENVRAHGKLCSDKRYCSNECYLKFNCFGQKV